MFLQLKRQGQSLDLFAKLELEPQEQAFIKTVNPGKTFLWMPDPISAQRQWRWNLIPGALLAFFVGWFIGMLILGVKDGIALAPWIGLVIWVPCTKVVFGQRREGITISDLLTGRTIHNRSLSELVEKEEAIKDGLQRLRGMFSYMRPSSEGETIKI
jgi:hypothetical protein